MLSGTTCGFSFPKELSKRVLTTFSSQASSLIHEVFFFKKKQLSSREREDFIEIFYFLLIIKAIALIDPDHIAFVSKDGLDTAVSSCADLYFCLKQFFSPKTELAQEDRDFLLWLLYGPILLLRERAIHKEDITRSAHVMETFQKGMSQGAERFAKGFKELFGDFLFPSVEIDD